MILKVFNEVEKGWTFVGDVKQVTVNKRHCIHSEETVISFPLVMYNGTGETLALSKNHGFLFGVDESFINDKEEFKKDVYIVKILIVEFTEGNKRSYAVKESTGVYLLNNEGKTIEHL